MQYDLVFEGGGAKGMAFVGACEELFDRGHTFGRLLGTSAGAITATLLAAGYKPDEMRNVLTEMKDGVPVFSTFMGLPRAFTDAEIEAGATLKLLRGIDFTFVPNRMESTIDLEIAKALARNESTRPAVALIERGGWYSADAFVAWLREKLDCGNRLDTPRRFSGLTMSEFFEATDVELSLVASDTTDARLLVINRHTAPECPVLYAVRMSMSIPLVWDEVVWQRSWGSYLGADISGHAIVDGGILSNFPIELFISDQAHITSLMGPKQENPIIGMLIDENMPVQEAVCGAFVKVDVDLRELALVQRLRRLVDTMTTANDKMIIEQYEELVVRMPAKDYGTTEFDMSETRRDALVSAGRRAMAEYFNTLESEAKGSIPCYGAAPLSPADRVASKILLF
jgi:predicted acylesterase/phospholipase RssA